MLTASDAAAAVGISPWKTVDELYNVKTGVSKEKDIGNKPCVVFGKKAEEHIRELFNLDFPDIAVDYHEFDIIQCTAPGFEWMGATLDGELQTASGRCGILEVKTGSFRGGDDLYKWSDRIPTYYYAQVLHQLACKDEAQFAIVAARLKRDPYRDNDQGMPEIFTRYYHFDRKTQSVKDDIEWIKAEEKKFWTCVQSHTRPDTKVRIGGNENE
jgi:putative phage-type endonuclease